MVKVKAIRVHEFGGPEVLKWEAVELGEPKEGEIHVKNKAIGVLTWEDVDIGEPQEGYEAVGVVTAIGTGVTGRNVGDLVVDMQTTRWGPMLNSRTFQKVELFHCQPPLILYSVQQPYSRVEAGHRVLVHAAAGGAGSLLCQWAKALDATVIGTVSTKEKAEQAAKDGCDHPIIYTQENFAERVREVANYEGVHVAYDYARKDTFLGSLECLTFRGYIVSYGQASGPINPIPPGLVASKGLFFACPSLMQHTAARDDLLASAEDLFSMITSGLLKIRVTKTFPLSEAAKAHAVMEERQSIGSIVLIPDDG